MSQRQRNQIGRMLFVHVAAGASTKSVAETVNQCTMSTRTGWSRSLRNTSGSKSIRCVGSSNSNTYAYTTKGVRMRSTISKRRIRSNSKRRCDCRHARWIDRVEIPNPPSSSGPSHIAPASRRALHASSTLCITTSVLKWLMKGSLYQRLLSDGPQ
jgi:hypothetical protein